MDLQSSQNNYNERDRLQTSESLSRFFSRITVSNKIMERIMHQESNLRLYDGFRIGGIDRVLNQIGLNQRKYHINYKVSLGEFAIPMEFTRNVMEMQLIPKEEIHEELRILINETGIELHDHIVEKIRNFPNVLKDKKHLQSFLGVVSFAAMFIKNLAKYKRDFRALLKETESSNWKWEETHTQRVRELKQRWRHLKQLHHVGFRHLRENLEELNKKFGWLAVNAQVAEQIQRAALDAIQIAIRTTMVASTLLWNDLQEPIRKASSSEMPHKLREQAFKLAFSVHDSRPVASDLSIDCTRPSPDSGETAIIGSQEVQAPNDSSQPSTSGVKDGEISLRPMTDTSKRPYMIAFNKIKAALGEVSLVLAISEDDISTKRAWGLWRDLDGLSLDLIDPRVLGKILEE
ncbi:UNVERIFIED_CONTAM: Enzymatic polyprotein [Sesamum calycinum]|uniref:Enzymatic polyprotein n=1 Tax=Sesamum calycinum TaxID=2727403 RepID=A0AAW2PBR2_9LAMI